MMVRPPPSFLGMIKRELYRSLLGRDIPLWLFSATDCAPPDLVFPAVLQIVGAAVVGGLKGVDVLTLVDNLWLFVLSNLSLKFLSNELDDVSTSLLLAGSPPAVLA